MNEQEWQSCSDPAPMLEFLRGKDGDRKLRLFAAACCRRVWNLLSDKHCRKALMVAERYADAEVSADKLHFAWGDARRAAGVLYRQDRPTAEATAMWAVSLLCEADIGRALGAVGLAALCEGYPNGQARLADAQREQVSLLRDIFGNPFRPVALDPSWLAWNSGTIPNLAQVIYDERTFERLPILADALEEAGCADAEILSHCRGQGPHVRGCWVVDLMRSSPGE